eukprot:296695-Pelagomonas_calceolata.AAC.1
MDRFLAQESEHNLSRSTCTIQTIAGNFLSRHCFLLPFGMPKHTSGGRNPAKPIVGKSAPFVSQGAQKGKKGSNTVDTAGKEMGSIGGLAGPGWNLTHKKIQMQILGLRFRVLSDSLPNFDLA